MNLSKLSYIFLSSILTLSCAKKISYALLDANITSNAISSRSRVNFTEYTATFSNDVLVATFSDGGGNSMTFTLRGASGDLPTESYTIDGSQNSFQTELILTSNLQSQQVTANATDGFINVNTISISGNTVTGFSGDFKVNLEGGGVAQGTYNTGG